VGRWFHEKQSGRSLQRPELAELRAAVRAADVRTLYVFRLDRLTRSGIRDTLALLEELRGAGCELVTVADGFDLGGPAADVVIAVMAWAAQMERLALGERIAAARVRVEAAGGRWGRPRQVGSATERRMLELAAEGRSVRQIAVATKVPRATVQRTLTRVKDVR
jgi:DNA invertase Pin-like site-specific DNA recombinase